MSTKAKVDSAAFIDRRKTEWEDMLSDLVRSTTPDESYNVRKKLAERMANLEYRLAVLEHKYVEAL